MFAPRAAIAACLALVSLPAFAAPCPADKPVLFIVQDKSGSMNQVPDPACTTCPTKWASSKSAVGQLTQKFQGAFRFGVQLYPQASTTFNCTTGTTVMPVPSTGTQIDTAYANAVPGGGTPTAASLDAARSYLTSLNLTEPAYVLLITDGLPNCNLSLDASTCTATTPGCENNSCGLGSKDCLDDQQTIQAAAALKNAGFKVYVVGFGTQVTSGNNKTVLDQIAQAGGTVTSYSANNQAALDSALSQVGYNAATCCNDVCTQGAAVCTSTGEREVCQMDTALGCTNWVKETCPNRSSCQGGVCTPCSDQCTLGAMACQGASAQQCVTGPYGCTVWTEVDTCTFGEVCQSGACNTCQTCQAGATRCNGQNSETCVQDATTGCTSWTTTTCTQGSACSAGQCKVCNTTCTAGAQRCAGRTPESCVADAYGCTSWQPQAMCADFCSGGACGTCGTTCAIGDTRCNGSTVESCTTDPHGCNTWVPTQTCADGEYCTGQSCSACPTTCTPGARQCSGAGIQECQVAATGCTEWAAVQTCGVDEGCLDGVCVEACKNACADGERSCSAAGDPLFCKLAPSGCTVWVAESACALGQVCSAGTCQKACDPSDAFSCAPEEACEDQGGQMVCMPGHPQKVKPGCGCASTDAAGLALIALLAFAALPRRRAGTRA